MSLSGSYYSRLAAAYVRGVAAQGTDLALSPTLCDKNLDELSPDQIEEILVAGRAAGLKLYRFKNTHDDLPRVRRVLGFLKSVGIGSLLDVGSGRGVFLWPCLNAFPDLKVTGIDILAYRVDLLKTVIRGGVANLAAQLGDICDSPVAEKSHDVVTMLEVLEHMRQPGLAIRSAVAIARQYVVVSVPSKPDNNPGHIHLLTKPVLAQLFHQAGCDRLHFDGVAGHLVLVATIGR